MWTSPDEARSDLMLSAGVFLLGGIVLGTILRYIPLLRLPVIGPVLFVALPLIVTILVPLLLIRYRGESLKSYGFGGAQFAPAFVAGAVASTPIIVAAVVLYLVTDNPRALPLLTATDDPIRFAADVARWMGLAGLVVYTAVKARDAFSSPARAVPEGVWEIGRIVAAVAAIATLLLLVRFGPRLSLVLLPLGVAGAVALTFQSLRGPVSTTTRATLVTGTVIAGLGAFALAFDPVALVQLTWAGAMAAGIGLIIAAMQEARRSAGAAVAIGLVAALLTPLELLRV